MIGTFLRIAAIWRAERTALLLGLFVALLSTAALAGLVLSAGAAPVALGGFVLLYALRGMGVARVVLRYLERLATHAATFRAQTALRVWMFRGLAANGAGGLGFQHRGDVLARLVGDVDALDGLYLRMTVPLASLLLLAVALAAVLGASAPALAVAVCLLLGAAALLIPWMVAHATEAEGRHLAEAAAALRTTAVDMLGGMRELRAFGNEGRMLAQLQAREATLLDAQRHMARRAARAQAAAVLCAQAALLLIVLDSLPPLTILPALLLTLAAFEAASVMPRAGALAGHAAAAAGRILATATPRTDLVANPPDPAPLPPGNGLRFESVRFAWPGRTPVFANLTLDIPAGTRAAILGPSGAGKSTLAALLLKAAEPQQGRILLGGTDLARLPAAALRTRIAWLSQATHLFNDTIRDNLRLGRPDADDAALWAALAQAGLADTVRALPEGLETWLGEGGTGLSGGQLRRVALARALLSDAPILILDEPATGLDDQAERAFFTALNEAAAGRTVILIVHRLLGIERIDRIWRLSGGHAIAATG